MPPRLVVVAGSNGAGKSTLTGRLRDSSLPIIDPDRIARLQDLSPVAAGREALRLFDNHCERRESFLIETTLSGKALLSRLQRAKKVGYHLSLRYVGLKTVRLARARVRQRVLLGGHDVPEKDIERRFQRSLANLPRALLLVHDARLYDNSSGFIRPVVDIVVGEVQYPALALIREFEWVEESLKHLDELRSGSGSSRS